MVSDSASLNSYHPSIMAASCEPEVQPLELYPAYPELTERVAVVEAPDLSSRAKFVKLNPRAELAGWFQVSVDVLTTDPSGWLVIPPMVKLPLCKAMLI